MQRAKALEGSTDMHANLTLRCLPAPPENTTSLGGPIIIPWKLCWMNSPHIHHVWLRLGRKMRLWTCASSRQRTASAFIQPDHCTLFAWKEWIVTSTLIKMRQVAGWLESVSGTRPTLYFLRALRLLQTSVTSKKPENLLLTDVWQEQMPENFAADRRLTGANVREFCCWQTSVRGKFLGNCCSRYSLNAGDSCL